MLADDVEPSPERQLRGDVCLQSERRTIPRTTNQTSLSRELETSTALPTRRTQPSHASRNQEALHYTLTRTGCIQPLASIITQCCVPVRPCEDFERF